MSAATQQLPRPKLRKGDADAAGPDDGSARRGKERPQQHQDPRPVYVARTELSLALPDRIALRRLPVSPDPLEPLAEVALGLRADLEDSIDVVLDLVAVSPSKVERRRRRLVSTARRSTGGGADWLSGLGAQIAAELVGKGQAAGRPAPAPKLSSADTKAAHGKFADTDEPVFEFQLLVRATSRAPKRPRALINQVTAALAGWNGHNRLQPVGLGTGRWRLTADRWPYRRGFDRRFESGAFAPRRAGRWVTGGEISGFLKPPTKHITAPVVARSGGKVPPAPPQLPTYTGQSDLLPLGFVNAPGGGERLVGVPLEFLLFALFLGKSGFGKTEMSLIQSIALAHSGHGVLFLDPHGDAWVRARPYLAHPELEERIWEIDLTNPSMDKYTTSWNPLSMENRSEHEIPEVVDAVVTGFVTALNWSDSAGRAKAILTRAIGSLVHLSLLLKQHGRQDLTPTIFQIPAVLTNPEWREALVPHLPKSFREFWTHTFPKYPADATPVVTNVIERLDASNAIKAFLGNSRSSYDVRHAMDSGKVVFVCPAGSGDNDRLISSLLIYDLFRAGLSRRSIPAAERKDFYCFIDELTSVDGSSRHNLAGITEQLRKYRVKLLAMTQMAGRLTPVTRQGFLQNLSILSTTASDIDEAMLVVKRWRNSVQIQPEAVTELPRYHYLMSVTHEGKSTAPFRVRGGSVEELYPAYCNPDYLDALEAAVTANVGRRQVRDILDDLEELNPRILEFLLGLQSPGKPPTGRPQSSAPERTPPRLNDEPGPELGTSAAPEVDTHDDTAAPDSASPDGTGDVPLPDNVVPIRSEEQ